jgi:hypothetical protein
VSVNVDTAALFILLFYEQMSLEGHKHGFHCPAAETYVFLIPTEQSEIKSGKDD